MVLSILVLAVESVSRVALVDGLPLVQSVDFIQSNAKRRVLCSEHLNRLKGLRFESVHDIDHKYSHVAKRRASGSQVSERLVTWSVDDQEAWDFKVDLFPRSHSLEELRQILLREVSCTDLLGDSASLSSLHIGLSQLI